MENKKIYNFLVISLFLFLFLGFVSSAQPSINIPTQSIGIQIEHALSDTIKVNQDHKFHFHIFNLTDGKPLNVSAYTCSFHLYNQSGFHIFKNNDGVGNDDIYDFEQIILGGNFTTSGQYSYVFQCNSSTIGGFYEHDFLVTPSGRSGVDNIWLNIFFITIIYLITFVGFFGRNEIITIFGGMFMMFLGVYLINNGIIIYRDDMTLYFSYMTIGLGFVFSSWASYELFKDL